MRVSSLLYLPLMGILRCGQRKVRLTLQVVADPLKTKRTHDPRLVNVGFVEIANPSGGTMTGFRQDRVAALPTVAAAARRMIRSDRTT